MKDILGFEGLYAVTKDGKIWSHYKSAWRKCVLDKDGYLYVILIKNRKNFNMKLHRAIALAYIRNPENLESINHKNGVKTDNRIENLEWCSMKSNRAHAQLNRLYRQGEKHAYATLTNKQISEIRRVAVMEKLGPSALAKRFKITKSHASNIVHYKTRKNG